MKKYLVSLICFCLVLALSNICYGEKYPLGVMTNEQIIEKYFFGRTLDPFEGLWESEPGQTAMIVKVEALDKQKERYAGWDYLVLGVDNRKDDASISKKLIKTKSPFICTKKEKNVDSTFTMLSPMSMVEKDQELYHMFMILFMSVFIRKLNINSSRTYQNGMSSSGNTSCPFA